MTVNRNGHTTGCKCNICIWAEWDGATKTSRFNIFTDTELGHLYAVLKPGRMLAEVTAEMQRREGDAIYAAPKFFTKTPKTCDGCQVASTALSIWVQGGVNLYYCPPCFELAQEDYYATKPKPPRSVQWQVFRQARGYPQYELLCECGWEFKHPSAIVCKQAESAHVCKKKLCKHGLTKEMGCCICKDEDYSHNLRVSGFRTSEGVTDCTHTNVGLCNDCMKDTQ